jgi:D-methionine transport system ATP-binding protein
MSRMIPISELTFAARDRRRILENVYLSVERGEVVGIIGETNTGKTLLMELIQGFVKPQSGQILVNDRNVTRLGQDKLQQLRQNLGVLPQNPVWPERLNIEESIKFKLSWMGLAPRQIDRKVDEVVALMALDSLRTQRFEDVTPLEQRTAYLALSLCHDPVLLLCDSSFDELDEGSTNTLSLMLGRIRQQRNLTLIITGQQQAPIQTLTDRLIQLEGGVLQNGTHESE